MSNVIQFKRPQESDAKTPMQELATVNRLFWEDTVQSLAQDLNLPFIDVLAAIGRSGYMAGFPDDSWAYVNVDLKVNFDQGKVEGCAIVSTDVRRLLVPEFGHQANKDFMGLTVMPTAPKSPWNDAPIDLLEQFAAYTMSFGEVSPSQKMQFGFAALAALLDRRDFKFMDVSITEASQFTVTFYRPEDGCEYKLTFDFLPVLLDSLALAYFGTLED